MERSNMQKQWYKQLEKPSWAPPSWLFGPVWTVLYIIIALSFGYVFYQTFMGAIGWEVAIPFVLNLAFNVLFTLIQFRLRSNTLAMMDIFAVFGTLVWALGTIYPIFPLVAYANIPYLAWVSFATVLQCTITYLNWGRES